MLTKWDLIVIAVGYLLGFLAGFVKGLKAGETKFWRMPSASWRARK